MTAVHSDMRQALVSTRSHYTAAGAFSLGINILYLTTPLYMLQVYRSGSCKRQRPDTRDAYDCMSYCLTYARRIGCTESASAYSQRHSS